MTVLIAESKTMREDGIPVPPETFAAHTPEGESVADDVMHRIALMPLSEISTEIKVSSAMAAKISRMAYDFPIKQIGMKAIEAYTGVVFRALDYDSLSAPDKEFAAGTVRLISSLYGWLRPEDVIKPYRMEFTTRLAPGDRTFADYWRKDVTIQLVRHVQNRCASAVLNLLPADAAKCVDWKLLKRFVKVWKVDFKELTPGGEYRTPHAGKLKVLRGELLREIITRRIETPAELLTLSTDNLLPLGTPDYPDHIAFCV